MRLWTLLTDASGHYACVKVMRLWSPLTDDRSRSVKVVREGDPSPVCNERLSNALPYGSASASLDIQTQRQRGTHERNASPFR